MSEWFSHAVSDFRGPELPEPGMRGGYAALIEGYDLRLPNPPRMAAIAERHHPASTSDWLMLTPRHKPTASLAGQLIFALKWEGVDLGVLSALFRTVLEGDLIEALRETPTGAFSRRLWYLYEWLTGQEL